VPTAGIPAGLLQCKSNVQAAVPSRRSPTAIRIVHGPHPRPAAPLRRPVDARCVRHLAGRADPADSVVQLARARPPGQPRLVSVQVTGADGHRRATPGDPPRRPVSRPAVSALAPSLRLPAEELGREYPQVKTRENAPRPRRKPMSQPVDYPVRGRIHVAGVTSAKLQQ
jgi:hypothetical protein